MGRTSLLFVAASLVICGFVQSSDAQNATGTNTPSKDITGGAGNPQDPAAAIADQKAEAAMTTPTDVQPTPPIRTPLQQKVSLGSAWLLKIRKNACLDRSAG